MAGACPEGDMVTLPPAVVEVLDLMADTFGELSDIEVTTLAPRDRCHCADLLDPGPCRHCDGPDRDEVPTCEA